ncbi:hypothetical protein [Spirosoma harenae]
MNRQIITPIPFYSGFNNFFWMLVLIGMLTSIVGVSVGIAMLLERLFS